MSLETSNVTRTEHTVADQAATDVLEVDGLHVQFRTARGVLRAVRGVSFKLGPSETIGIVGESGSGKSVTARAIMRLLPQPTTEITAGRVLFQHEDLLTVSRARMREVRGAGIAMVYQDPMRALNPTMRLGDQIAEAVRAHDPGCSRRNARVRAVEMLDAVQIPDAKGRARAYPHQLSGGMRQRVVIAMALSARPKVLIADEPTTSLDVTIQAQILDLLAELQRELKMSMILVTHDLGVAAWHTHRIHVMYAGQIVEEATTDTLFTDMRMPYTRALFNSIPRLEHEAHRPLAVVPGRPPDAAMELTGCSFWPRCDRASEQCRTQAPPVDVDLRSQSAGFHSWRCWHPIEAGVH